jgi:AcrR family transcriptional regulator
MLDQLAATDTSAPRKPERENGKRRYAVLLAASEKLLERDGLAALTIQNIAREAGVPMASVYHFFPSPMAACVAVAETYLDGFAANIQRDIAGIESLNWREIIIILKQRTVEYYRAHPYAQRIILGSEVSWHIRQADLANNRMMAQMVCDLIIDQFPGTDEKALLNAIAVGISIGDAIWSLSISEHDVITKQYAEEAVIAECAYLSAKFPQNRQS